MWSLTCFGSQVRGPLCRTETQSIADVIFRVGEGHGGKRANLTDRTLPPPPNPKHVFKVVALATVTNNLPLKAAAAGA